MAVILAYYYNSIQSHLKIVMRLVFFFYLGLEASFMSNVARAEENYTVDTVVTENLEGKKN